MPTWFDEGLAMQLDQSSDYDGRALEAYRQAGLLSAKTLDQLASPGRFFAPGNQGKAHYAFAKCVVEHWFAVSGRADAMKLLEAIDWSRSFPSQEFEIHARACLGRSA
jgi:hypothetical protein